MPKKTAEKKEVKPAAPEKPKENPNPAQPVLMKKMERKKPMETYLDK